MAGAYYNENDRYAAQWLRNLISAGHIAPGHVDERSIADVAAGDLDGFTQCHFFAGIGIWSHALRRAGWPDDRPIWTGSCPCQPFSGAGKRKGKEDERHLWPVWSRLIRECRPGVILGEQVASRDALDWLDHVHTDMEAADYAFAAIDMGVAGVGGPHWRQRLWWMAHPHEFGRPERHERSSCERGAPGPRFGSLDGGMAYAHGHGCNQARLDRPAPRNDGVVRNGASVLLEHAGCSSLAGQHGRGAVPGLAQRGDHSDMADASSAGLSPRQCEEIPRPQGQHEGRATEQLSGASAGGWPGPVNGFWTEADWLLCTDGKWRPVEPGTFPLAHGHPQRVGQLRAYGNAICAEAATAFIEAARGCLDE